MKKLFALMLALCLLCSVAMAEDAVEANWADVEAAAANYGGDFVAIEEMSLKIWLPNGYSAYDPDEESAGKGIFRVYAPEDGSGAVALQYVEANGADVATAVNAIEGASDAKPMVVNGLSCINFDMKDDDATCVAFGTQKGNLFVMIFAPMSSAAFAEIAPIMLASLQSAD